MTSRTEPGHAPLRPIAMTHAPSRLLALVTCALVLAACGSADRGSGSAGSDGSGSGSGEGATASADPSDASSECASTEPGPGVEAPVDVDGDGRPEVVTFTASSSCGGPLLQAGSGDDPPRTTVAAGEPPVRQIFGVRVPGRTGELVVTRSTHPRGGYQLRVYAADGSRSSS